MKDLITPDYIFESSWEVCNKVGGIYTVLSTRANTLQQSYPDKLFFIGPDLWELKENPLFIESDDVLKEWKVQAVHDGLKVRVGRWNVPGQPIAILVDFLPFFHQKNDIYARAWELGKVDSMHAYGDYDECCMFAYAAARVVTSIYKFQMTPADKVVYQAHEWQTGMSTIFLKEWAPEIATVFTTHATSIGRSIAGNNKPLYDYLFAYNGDQMSHELNIVAKHSVEKQAAHSVDCFTTVSEITGQECQELLERPADVILMNGFEDDFVPKTTKFTRKRKEARETMLNVANKLLGTNLGPDTLIVGTSGRYEYRNKGLGVYLEGLKRLNRDKNLKRDVLAFIYVPAWVGEPREDLQKRLEEDGDYTGPLEVPFVTHWLNNMTHDQVLDGLKYLNMHNHPEDKVKVVFVPCYLHGDDGIMHKEYYDLLIGNDLTVYASYYEPWGYTPLESVAFKVPTITTDKAGFGLWVEHKDTTKGSLIDGVAVLERTDYNGSEVADEIRENILDFTEMNKTQVNTARRNAGKIAEQALWKHFIQYYYEAYDVALRRAQARNAQR